METPENKFDTESTSVVTCPWCGYEDLNSWEIDDSYDNTIQECGRCSKEFRLWVDIDVTYSTAKEHEDGLERSAQF